MNTCQASIISKNLEAGKGLARSSNLLLPGPAVLETEGYGVDFGFEQYEQMAEVMRSCKGKVMLSINDHPDIRSVLTVAFELLAASFIRLIKVL